MTTVYSAQKTKWDQTEPSEFIKANEMAGRIRIAYADYEAAALPANDVIEMFNLPNGARLVGGYLAHDALGGSTTLSVGFAAHTNSAGDAVSADAVAYKAAAASTSASRVDVLATLAKGFGSETDVGEGGVPVTVTLAGGVGTGTIALAMYYVVD